MSVSADTTLRERAFEALKQKGNPFRQQFARNADDPVCSLYHVDELFSTERQILQSLVESFRGQTDRPTCVLPVLGARGAGKTHLLHCLKHLPGTGPEMFITPGTFRIEAAGSDSSFLEYLLYQFINVLLAGGEQRGARPLDYVGEQLTRQVLVEVIGRREKTERLELTGSGGFRRWAHRLGLGVNDSLNSIDAFVTQLSAAQSSCKDLTLQANLDPEKLHSATLQFLEHFESRDLIGQFRRKLIGYFIQSALLGDEAPLADFLTDGFVEVDFLAKPSRAQLTLALLQALIQVIVGAGIPVAVAFDQLEELLYGQTDEEIRRSSDGFFGGLVQLMSQVPGLAVLLFVEEGLWNRIVPPLPSHILDRIHEPLHVEQFGTVRSVRLSTPSKDQLTQVVSRRVKRTLSHIDGIEQLPDNFPFGDAFLERLSRKETVLRLMLQGCCNRLDEILTEDHLPEQELSQPSTDTVPTEESTLAVQATPANNDEAMKECWQHELRAAIRKLKPVGSLSGAAEELRGGMVRWLHLCKELGVEQGDWRMTAIEDHLQVGDHPSYGLVTLVEWSRTDGEKQKIAVGMWLGRGVGKPRDLETKLNLFDTQPPLADHLILFRPSDDVRLSGKTKAAWDAAITSGASVCLEPVELEVFAKLYAFPRWMQQVSENYTENVPDWVYSHLASETESIMLKLGLPEKDAHADGDEISAAA